MTPQDMKSFFRSSRFFKCFRFKSRDVNAASNMNTSQQMDASRDTNASQDINAFQVVNDPQDMDTSQDINTFQAVNSSQVINARQGTDRPPSRSSTLVKPSPVRTRASLPHIPHTIIPVEAPYSDTRRYRLHRSLSPRGHREPAPGSRRGTPAAGPSRNHVHPRQYLCYSGVWIAPLYTEADVISRTSLDLEPNRVTVAFRRLSATNIPKRFQRSPLEIVYSVVAAFTCDVLSGDIWVELAPKLIVEQIGERLSFLQDLWEVIDELAELAAVNMGEWRLSDKIVLLGHKIYDYIEQQFERDHKELLSIVRRQGSIAAADEYLWTALETDLWKLALADDVDREAEKRRQVGEDIVRNILFTISHSESFPESIEFLKGTTKRYGFEPSSMGHKLAKMLLLLYKGKITPDNASTISDERISPLVMPDDIEVYRLAYWRAERHAITLNKQMDACIMRTAHQLDRRLQFGPWANRTRLLGPNGLPFLRKWFTEDVEDDITQDTPTMPTTTTTTATTTTTRPRRYLRQRREVRTPRTGNNEASGIVRRNSSFQTEGSLAVRRTRDEGLENTSNERSLSGHTV